jgi:hypothetical protein
VEEIQFFCAIHVDTITVPHVIEQSDQTLQNALTIKGDKNEESALSTFLSAFN